MARFMGGVALVSLALMALCCVLVLHVDNESVVKTDAFNKEGEDAYSTDMTNLMQLLQAEKPNSEDDLTGEEKALVAAADDKDEDDLNAGTLHWSQVEASTDVKAKHSSKANKDEDARDELSNSDRALIAAADGGAGSHKLTKKNPSKNAVRKMEQAAHAKKLRKQKENVKIKHDSAAVNAQQWGYDVHLKVKKAKKKDPRDELSNDEKALLAAADGVKVKHVQRKVVKRKVVKRKVVKKVQKVHEKKQMKKVTPKVHKPKTVAKVYRHKEKQVHKPKVEKKAKKPSRFAELYHHHHRSEEKHQSKGHDSKDALTGEEKALLAAADAGSGTVNSHTLHKVKKVHPQKAVKVQVHKAVQQKKVHKAVQQKKVHKAVQQKKVHKAVQQVHTLVDKHPKVLRAHTKHPKVLRAHTVVHSTKVHRHESHVPRDVPQHHTAPPRHKAQTHVDAPKQTLTTVPHKTHNVTPKLPSAMRRAMEKITKAATKQAMTASTRDNLRRASKDVAAHAVAVQTNANLHLAKKAVQSHLHHLKKVKTVKEQKQKHKIQLHAQEKKNKKQDVKLKRKQMLKSVATNNSAREMVLSKPGKREETPTRKTMQAVDMIKAQIAALKPVKVQDQWAAMKAKADHQAKQNALASVEQHQLSASDEARAAAMQMKLEHQEEKH